MTVFLSVTFRPAIQSPSLSTTTLGFKLPQASESETVFHLLWIHLGTLLKNEGRAFRMLRYCGGCGCGATCWFSPVTLYFVISLLFWIVILLMSWLLWKNEGSMCRGRHTKVSLLWNYGWVILQIVFLSESFFVCIVWLYMVTRIDIQCAIYCFRMGISVANVNF